MATAVGQPERPARAGAADVISAPSEVVAIIARTVRSAIVTAVIAGDFEKAKVLGERLAQLEARPVNDGPQAAGSLMQVQRQG